MISVLDLGIALVSMILGGAVVAAGFIRYVETQRKEYRALDRKIMFALMQTGNLFAAAGLKERYSDELLRMLLAVERNTPFNVEAIK